MAKAKAAAFGGYAVSFKGQATTMEELFGREPIGPGEMTKVLWSFVKARKLATKKG